MVRNEKGQFVKGSCTKDIAGQRFGKLKALYLDKQRTGKKTYWICECECGNVKSIRSDCLKIIQSCGCVKKEQDMVNLHVKNNHNMANHKAYVIWYNIMNRCYSKANEHYVDYGGRGITVCEEWHDVKKFCAWADESGFRKELTIERNDVNGNYEPSNCRWTTRQEQAWNKRNTFYCKINGEKIPAAKLSLEYGIPLKTLKDRYRRGITDKDKLLYKGNLKYYKS